MNHLLKALRTVRLIDSGAQRALIFEELRARSLVLRLVVAVAEKLHGSEFSRLMYGTYGAKALLSQPYRMSVRYGLLTACDHGNEHRAVVALLALADDQHEPQSASRRCLQGLRALSRSLRQPHLLRRYLRCVGRLERGENFLTTCRTASTLGSYLLASWMIDTRSPRAVLISSNYTPSTAALAAAARQRGLPVIFTSRAIIPIHDDTPPLQADLAILYGSSAIEAFSAHGPFEVSSVIFKGIPGAWSPLRPITPGPNGVRVGVFLTGETEESKLQTLMELLQGDPTVESVLIRPHPLQVLNPPFERYLRLFPKLIVDSSGTAAEAAMGCAYVIAGNSSVHVDVLHCGIPSCYLAGLDRAHYDTYGFVGSGVVPEVELSQPISAEWINSWYDGAWPARFRTYDASYLITDFSAAPELREALEQVCQPPQS